MDNRVATCPIAREKDSMPLVPRPHSSPLIHPLLEAAHGCLLLARGAPTFRGGCINQCPVHQCCHHWRTFISSCIGTWGFIHTELHSYVNPRVPYQCHVDHTSCWSNGTSNNLWEYLLKDTYTVLSSAPIICRSVCVQCQCKWNEQNCQLCLQCVSNGHYHLYTTKLCINVVQHCWCIAGNKLLHFLQLPEHSTLGHSMDRSQWFCII
eukprot:Em0011g1202a